MNELERIQSTIDSENQINKQQGEGHLCLHRAYIGRGKPMKRSGFEDYTLSCPSNSLEAFKKAIKEEPRSNVYVEVNYYVDSSRIRTWKIVTWEKYCQLPTTWIEFKKLVNKGGQKNEN